MKSKNEKNLEIDNNQNIISGRIAGNSEKLKSTNFVPNKGLQGTASLRPVRSLKRRSLRPMTAWIVNKDQA